MSNPFMRGVVDDPVPWLTERFRSGGVFDDDIEQPEYLSRVLGVAQSTVNAMSDHNKTFVVKYSGSHGSAYTDGKKQEVVIGTRPVTDSSLTPGQQAAIVLALAAHEVGHVRWSVTIGDRIQKHYAGDSFKSAWAARVFNVLHDIHLEHHQQADFPVLRDVLTLKGLYFARPWTLDLSRNVTRYGALINATLYPHATDWTSPEGAAFKAWADDWAQRATEKKARTLKGAVALIDEALDYLRYDEQPDIPPEDKPTEPSDDEDEDEDEDPDEDGTEDTEPTDADSDEDEDDEGEGTGSDSDEDGDDGDDGSEPDEGDEDGDESGADTDGDEESGSGAPPEHRDGETVDDPGEGEDDDSTDDGEDTERTIGDEGDADSRTEPLPTIHGEMHSTVDRDLQDTVDAYQRTQAAGRDRFVVGGGDFHKREVRILRVRV